MLLIFRSWSCHTDTHTHTQVYKARPPVASTFVVLWIHELDFTHGSVFPGVGEDYCICDNTFIKVPVIYRVTNQNATRKTKEEWNTPAPSRASLQYLSVWSQLSSISFSLFTPPSVFNFNNTIIVCEDHLRVCLCAGEVWPVLAQSRHRDLWDDSGDHAGHCGAGYVQRTHIRPL